MNTYPLPQRYKGLIDTAAYNLLLEISTVQIKRIYKVEQVSIDEGSIFFQIEEKEARFHLDNLIDRIKKTESHNWQAVIEQYFDKLQDRTDAYDYFFKDFDHSREFLKLVVKPDAAKIPSEEFVSRVDFPGTRSYLVFDFQDQFYYIRKDKAAEWEKEEDFLIRVALDNLMKEPIRTHELVMGGEIPVFCYFSGDFAAAHLLNLHRNPDFPIGTLGAVVVIASKSVSFAAPINATTDLLVLPYLAGAAAEFTKDYGAITPNPYWFDGTVFYPFTTSKQMEIQFPEKLLEKIYGQN